MMKEIKWSRQFARYYKQRISKDATLTEAFWDSVEAFSEDPLLVDDHPLQGVMEGQRSFSINDDYRVVYIEQEDHYQFIDVGTHEQVYRRS